MIHLSGWNFPSFIYLAPMSTENIKNSPIPSYIDIKPHTKSLFTSILIARYIMSGLQQKIARHPKRQEKKQSKDIKQASESDSDMAQIWGL